MIGFDWFKCAKVIFFLHTTKGNEYFLSFFEKSKRVYDFFRTFARTFKNELSNQLCLFNNLS